jgi:acyl-CoA thioester hydrolase
MSESAPSAELPGYTAHVPVRWSDMDVIQHINHAKMVTLLEESRIDWLSSTGPDTASMLTSAIVAHLDLRFKSPLKHSDSPLAVTMWIEKIRSVDLTIRYEVRPAGAAADSKPAVAAMTQMAIGDEKTQSLRRLTTEERELLSQWVRA